MITFLSLICANYTYILHGYSIVIACLKRLLPVGLNVFGGRELDIVQQCKERFLSKENEEKTREFIRELLDIPVKVS